MFFIVLSLLSSAPVFASEQQTSLPIVVANPTPKIESGKFEEFFTPFSRCGFISESMQSPGTKVSDELGVMLMSCDTATERVQFVLKNGPQPVLRLGDLKQHLSECEVMEINVGSAYIAKGSCHRPAL